MAKLSFFILSEMLLWLITNMGYYLQIISFTLGSREALSYCGVTTCKTKTKTTTPPSQGVAMLGMQHTIPHTTNCKRFYLAGIEGTY